MNHWRRSCDPAWMQGFLSFSVISMPCSFILHLPLHRVQVRFEPCRITECDVCPVHWLSESKPTWHGLPTNVLKASSRHLARM